jgi:hypothetical protein
MHSHEYLVLGPIPEIDGRPGDILVWDYPTVALVRRVQNRPEFALIELHPNHWWHLFSKYEDRLVPHNPHAPAVASPRIAVGGGLPLRAGRQAPLLSLAPRLVH